MAKKTAAATLDQPITVSTVKYDSQALAAIALKVKAEGFVPASVLREEFGAEKTTQGIAVLYRDMRMFREVRRAWGEDGQEVLGYEWAERKFSKPEQNKIPPQLGFVLELSPKMAPRYSDFQPVSVKCRWTAPLLGSKPVKDANGDPTNVFERDAAGNILILRYNQRAMATMALPMIGKEQALARRIGWSIIRVHANGNVKTVEHGIIDGGQAKGLRRSEYLPDGEDFTIRAMVPTSMLALDEFLRMLRYAGQYIGLSPGRSAGFGDFEVLGAE